MQPGKFNSPDAVTQPRVKRGRGAQQGGATGLEVAVLPDGGRGENCEEHQPKRRKPKKGVDGHIREISSEEVSVSSSPCTREHHKPLATA